MVRTFHTLTSTPLAGQTRLNNRALRTTRLPSSSHSSPCHICPPRCRLSATRSRSKRASGSPSLGLTRISLGRAPRSSKGPNKQRVRLVSIKRTFLIGAIPDLTAKIKSTRTKNSTEDPFSSSKRNLPKDRLSKPTRYNDSHWLNTPLASHPPSRSLVAAPSQVPLKAKLLRRPKHRNPLGPIPTRHLHSLHSLWCGA